MKALVFIIIAFLSFDIMAQKKDINIVIRGDDMGYSHNANLACIQAYQEGVMSSVEVMAVTPWFMEAVVTCNENPGLDAGLHLALTSEWTGLKWRPLSHAPSLTDTNGYFYPMIWPNNEYPEEALYKKEWVLEEIEKELRTQIELTKKHIPHLSHLTTHMGFPSIHESVEQLVNDLAKEYELIYNPTLKRANYHELEKDNNYVRAFCDMLLNLEKGDYLFVDHPGINNDEAKAIYLYGNDQVHIQRQGVTNALTSECAQQIIQERNIGVIGYNDL